ncbi:ATP-grasp peptide maturase system methyltransferase [Actinoplanes sp. NPDC049548]|uniref:ATP-grasp peptide maturase system methyltransferase n=1 Tax=Actinoplanes sp. NPDC049548 TaxID=3155152 RepID=UPI003435FD68
MSTNHAEERAALTASLYDAGELTDPHLIDAFKGVPRAAFLPAFFVPTPDGRWRAIDSSSAEYLPMVYADTTLTTQLDGKVDPDPAAEPRKGLGTSSSTQPGLMASMLEALSLTGGERVLEIGTGTGYNAALLCHRLGDRQVTSVEVDQQVTDVARDRLRGLGYLPTVVTGDGAAGWPDRAPYDRVIATASFPTIPRAWVEQTVDGGLIVASLWRDLGGGPLVRLIVQGGQARGHFLAQFGGFMPTREVTMTADALSTALGQKGVTRPTRLRGDVLTHPHAGLWIALRVCGVTWTGFTPDGGHEQLWLFAPDGSWAVVEDAAGTVEQYGTRNLWDEVESVHQQWTDVDQPNRERMGLTVTRNGAHEFWLDDPANIQWRDPA